MAVTGWKFPGSALSGEIGFGDEAVADNWGNNGNDWTLTNVGANDGTVAGGICRIGNAESDRGAAWNFGFTASDVPSGATIDGVEVEYLDMDTAQGGRYFRLSEVVLTKDGGLTSVGTSQAKPDTTANDIPGSGDVNANVLYGGSTNLWGTTLTQSEVVNSDFGVWCRKIIASSASGNMIAQVDSVRMRIYYTAGGTTITGSGAATTAATTASGTAEREITGSGAATTAATTASGTGSVQGTVTGTGAATTAAITASGVAEREITGTGAATIGAVTASGSGTVGNEITGTGAATIAAITASGTAEREITASGAVTTGVAQASGTASRGQDATGAATIAAVTASGTAEREITGTGAATIGAVEASGIGALDGEVAGSGAATIAPVDASGSGLIVSITPERQPGGWLPTIYVDRDGNEVDLDEKVAEVVAEAKADATKPQRKKIAKVAPEVIAAFRADEFKPTKEMERLAAHLGQVEAKYERMLRDAIEARRRQDEDDEAVALLLIA